VPEHALKEWAVTCAALAAGDQVLVLRKGGIGEKRFALPAEGFFLFPAYAHQRPELVVPHVREALADTLARRDEPPRLTLWAYARVHAAHAITEQEALGALDGLHALTPDYAAERLRWRRTQPLAALVLRVYRPSNPPVLTVGPEHGGCVSWIALPAAVTAGPMTPVLDDDDFAAAAGAVEQALAGARAGRPA
jgi:hypothetical protein